MIAPLTNQRDQGGFSLVELMVATTLGLLIILVVTSLYSNISLANREMARTNGQIENARFAMQFLKRDVIHAGYWGGYVPEFDDLTFADIPTDVPTLVPDPCLAYGSWNANYVQAALGIPVQVYNSVPGTCGGIVSNRLAGTDVLVVRHAETCIPGTGNCPAEVSGRLYFQHSNCEAEIDAGQIFALDPNSFPLLERDCGEPGGDTPAAKRRFMQNIYYIRDYLETPGDGTPTLMRSEFDITAGVPAQQPALPFVGGIEGFHVELGIDSLSDSGAAPDYTQAVTWADVENRTSPTNRGDGVFDGAWAQCTACTAAQFYNTVALRLHLLARAETDSPGYRDIKTYSLGGRSLGPFNDGFKRHAFSSTVRMITISGRRETP